MEHRFETKLVVEGTSRNIYHYICNKCGEVYHSAKQAADCYEGDSETEALYLTNFRR